LLRVKIVGAIPATSLSDSDNILIKDSDKSAFCLHYFLVGRIYGVATFLERPTSWAGWWAG